MNEPRTNWKYPEEEAQWHADNPPQSQKLMGNSKKEQLSVIQKIFDEEFKQFMAFLDGKLDMSDEIYFIWSGKKIYYIEFPELFDKDVDALTDCRGELDAADIAWINNTRNLIHVYHVIAVDKYEKTISENTQNKKVGKVA